MCHVLRLVGFNSINKSKGVLLSLQYDPQACGHNWVSRIRGDGPILHDGSS